MFFTLISKKEINIPLISMQLINGVFGIIYIKEYIQYVIWKFMYQNAVITCTFN